MKKLVPVLFVLFFMFALLTDPDTGKSAVSKGLLLCGRVMIPSLFPFTVCVLFIEKSGILHFLSPLQKITYRLFHLQPEHFALVLLSMIGGYPIGAKLLNESVKGKRMSERNAGLMLCYSVNAGPAFILLTVGNGLFRSVAVGRILLAAHLLSTVILAFFCGFFLQKEKSSPKREPSLPLSDCFVFAVSNASGALLNICAYVLFFSVFIAFWNRYFSGVPFLANLSCLLEITCGLTATKNVLFVSFLLGFAGLSVWCQVFSLAKEIPIRFGAFCLTRALHGLLSVFITFLFLHIFPTPLPTSSHPKITYTYDSFALSLALLVMAIIFLLSLFQESSSIKTAWAKRVSIFSSHK